MTKLDTLVIEDIKKQMDMAQSVSDYYRQHGDDTRALAYGARAGAFRQVLNTFEMYREQIVNEQPNAKLPSWMQND